MTEFTTQFPVSNDVSNPEFVALSILWLRGIKKSKILDTYNLERYEDDARLSGENGEHFCLKSFNEGPFSAIGFQHSIPDGQGRDWITETVLSKSNNNAWIRVRTRCVATATNIPYVLPKKPAIIKLMIDDGWASSDGSHDVGGIAHFLEESDVDLAARTILGQEKTVLPIVYVSKDNHDKNPISPQKLANDLCGLAHVFVEPTRAFSIKLMEQTAQSNPYGGAIGICVPNYGVQKRFYKRSYLETQRSIIDAIQSYLIRAPLNGFQKKALEWQDLQELQNRSLRHSFQKKIEESNTNEAELNEFIEAYDDEISSKDKTINELKEQVDTTRSELENINSANTTWINYNSIKSPPSELYNGEISDRIKRILSDHLRLHKDDLSKRDRYILEKIFPQLKPTGRSKILVERLKLAGASGNTWVDQLSSILVGLGYTKVKKDKTHIKFHPPSSLGGIPMEVLPKTPSDYRAGKNKVADILRSFALKNLDK